MPSLKAENVELENDAGRGRKNSKVNTKKEAPLLINTDDAELQIISGSKFVKSVEKALSDSENENVSNARMKRDFVEQQQLLRDTISTDLPKLANRSVLLVGNVLEAFISSAANDGTDRECKILYKVLFVEGGSQPTMFRCKTPVFTSVGVNELFHPIWNDSQFRFDMMMPLDVSNQSSLQLQGEVVIGFYQTRTNGGNDLIGQISFDLTEMAEVGTSEYFEEGYEVRNVHGNHTILSRGKEEVGEAEILLAIAWQANNGGDSDDARSIRGSVTGMTPNKSKRSTRFNTTAKATAFNQTKAEKPQPRKIVSAVLRKQREDNARIEKENKILQSRIQQLATKAGKTLGAGGAYSGTPQAAPALPPTQQRQNFLTTKEKQTHKNLSSSSKESGLLQSLLQMLTDLKKEIASRDKGNQMLRSKLLILRTQVAKYETSLRMKSRASVVLSARSSMVDGKSIISGPMTARSVSSAMREPEEPNRHDHRVANNDQDAGNSKANYYAEADAELRGLVEEYEVLQNVRRSVVARAKTAKKKYDEAVAVSRLFAAKRALAERRMHYFSNGEIYLDEFDTELNPNDEDFQIFEEHNSSLLDLLRAQSVLEEGIHLVPAQSSEAELQAAVAALKRQKERLQEQVSDMKKQRDSCTSGLSKLIESSRVLHMREFLSYMKSLQMRFDRNERIAAIEDGFNSLQLELLKLQNRLRMRDEERTLTSFS